MSITGAFVCEQSFVYKARKNNADSWEQVWVPAVPVDGEYVKSILELIEAKGEGDKLDHLPPPRDIRVLLKTTSVKNHADLDRFSKSALTGPITGVVTNKIESLGSKEKEILEQNYPGIDFSRCYLVDHERKPASMAKLAALIGGGALLTLIGAGWAFAGWRSSRPRRPWWPRPTPSWETTPSSTASEPASPPIPTAKPLGRVFSHTISEGAGMNVVKLLMIVCGLILLVFGVQEYRLASESSQTPQKITCAELAANGPGKNAYITLTNARLCGESFVYKTDPRGIVNEWKQVWIPAVPPNIRLVDSLANLVKELRGETPPKPKDIHVLIKTSHVKDEKALRALAGQGEITGLVTNKIESLGSKEKEILEQNYPGIDFDRCYVIEHDRKPQDILKVAAMIGGGGLMALAGVAWAVAGLRLPGEPPGSSPKTAHGTIRSSIGFDAASPLISAVMAAAFALASSSGKPRAVSGLLCPTWSSQAGLRMRSRSRRSLPIRAERRFVDSSGNSWRSITALPSLDSTDPIDRFPSYTRYRPGSRPRTIKGCRL